MNNFNICKTEIHYTDNIQVFKNPKTIDLITLKEKYGKCLLCDVITLEDIQTSVNYLTENNGFTEIIYIQNNEMFNSLITEQQLLTIIEYFKTNYDIYKIELGNQDKQVVFWDLSNYKNFTFNSLLKYVETFNLLFQKSGNNYPWANIPLSIVKDLLKKEVNRYRIDYNYGKEIPDAWIEKIIIQGTVLEKYIQMDYT